jgi:phosphatidylglycerol---prolipoprotein diacylglyceryl transferase
MLPVLLSLGPVTIYTFGVMLAISLLLSFYVVWKRGKELYFNEEELFDSLFIILGVFLIGSRLGYVMVHFDEFGFNVFSWLNIIGKPGFIYITGFLAGMAAAFWQAKIRKWDYYATSDVLVVGLALSLSIMSLANFFNGSGYGAQTQSFIGVQFAGLYEKRIPVQLFEFVFYGLLFTFLWRLEATYRTIGWYKGSRSEANNGFITALFLIAQGVIGLGVLLFREGELLFSGFTIDIPVYFFIALGGIALLLNRSDLNFNTTTVFQDFSEKLRTLRVRNEKRD